MQPGHLLRNMLSSFVSQSFNLSMINSLILIVINRGLTLSIDSPYLSTPLNDPALEQYRRNLAIGSSLDCWRQVEVPVFFGFGEDDHLVDVKTSAGRLEGLIQNGQENFELHVYPSPAGHAIGTSATPTYFQDLRQWFQESVLGPYREKRAGKK